MRVSFVPIHTISVYIKLHYISLCYNLHFFSILCTKILKYYFYVEFCFTYEVVKTGL